jgi:hypothetical protein
VVITNALGVEEDAGAVTSSVVLPDGTTAPASPITLTKTATGRYAGSLVSTQPGRHRPVSTATGANAGGPYTDVIDVWPADPRLIISLADARAALNTAPTTRVNDDELRGYLVAAGIVIESMVGTVLTRTVVESRDGSGRMSISLHERPTAITTVVENGTTLAASAFYLDQSGTLWRGSSPGAGTWSGLGRTVVTYTAGSSVVPQNVILAAGHLIRHWWNQSQQSYRPYMGSAAEDMGAVMVAGYAVPNFVVDLLAPSRANRMPGFA